MSSSFHTGFAEKQRIAVKAHATTADFCGHSSTYVNMGSGL